MRLCRIGPAPWPCDFTGAKSVRLQVATSAGASTATTDLGAGSPPWVRPKVKVTEAKLETPQLQDLSDAIPDLLKISAKTGVPIAFSVRIKVGDGTAEPPPEVVAKLNDLLGPIAVGLRFG